MNVEGLPNPLIHIQLVMAVDSKAFTHTRLMNLGPCVIMRLNFQGICAGFDSCRGVLPVHRQNGTGDIQSFNLQSFTQYKQLSPKTYTQPR